MKSPFDEHPNDVARSIAEVAWGMERRRGGESVIGNEVYVEAIVVVKRLQEAHASAMAKLKKDLAPKKGDALRLERIAEHVPRLVAGEQGMCYAEFLVEVLTCVGCLKLMIAAPPKRLPKVFPTYCEASFESQRLRAGLALAGPATPAGRICEGCSKAGEYSVTCSLCEKLRPLSAIEETFGLNADDLPRFYLCRPCYEARSAKEWGEKSRELSEETRYDFE